MANIKSAKKRIKVSKRNPIQNLYYKTSIKNLIKFFFENLELYKSTKDPEYIQKLKKLLKRIYSLIDKSVKKKIFHRNKAARKKSKLAKYLKEISI